MTTPTSFAVAALVCFTAVLFVAAMRYVGGGIVSVELDVIQAVMTGVGYGCLILSWITNL